MSAKTNGESFFQIDENESENSERNGKGLTDRAMRKVLQTLQTAIIILVNQRNDAALQAFQACCGELFREASEARKQGRSMDVRELPCDRQVNHEKK